MTHYTRITYILCSTMFYIYTTEAFTIAYIVTFIMPISVRYRPTHTKTLNANQYSKNMKAHK